MDKKKLIILIMIVVAVIGIILGIVLSFNSKEEKKDTDTDLTPGELIDLKENKNKGILEEHCYEGICLSNMDISSTYDEYYVANVQVTNKSEVDQEEKYLKLVFQLKKGYYEIVTSISALQVNETYEKMIGLEDNKLLEATNYTIETPTQEEIDAYNNPPEEPQE